MKIARWQIYIICSYLLLILYFIISRVFFLKFYLQGLFEDRYVEWAQFYLLVFASVLCFKLTSDIWSKEKHIHYFYVLFGLLCMLVAIDEISWGQRIFGFESPRFFVSYNAQKETDFHNIMGEYVDRVIDYDYLIGLFGIIYGIVLPIVVSFSRDIAAFFHTRNLVIPPRVLIIGFLSGAIFMGLSSAPLYEEIGEFFIYLSLFYLFLIKWDEQKRIKSPDGEQVSFSRTIVKLSVLILCIAVVSTVATDLRAQPYGPGLTYYDKSYAGFYDYYGFQKEAVERYEKALGINPDSQGYSFLKNLGSANIEISSHARTTISVLDIDRDLRLTLFEHPPSKITYKLPLPERASLSFGIALSPETWSADKGDGVLFELYVQGGGIPERVFSKYIDPKRNVADRKWHDEVVDLSRYGGKEVTLSFVTTPGFNNNSDFDWAVWSAPSLNSNNRSSSR